MVLDRLISILHSRSAALPDKRRGQNVQYDMADIVMSAFAVFFTQSPSFLAHQQALERRQRSSNCQMLFAIKKIPSDNHIRDMLDPVPPQKLFSLFRTALDCLAPSDGEGAQAAHTVAKPDALASFRRLNGHILIALDGTEYFTSQKLGCPTCSTRQRNNGQKEQYHTMLCAALVAPRHNRALPLEPEFIEPQDGHDKQDCETAAVKRWLAAHGDHYARLRPVYLGDDLFSRQPICAAVQAAGGNFIFTAKPTSHKTISEWIDGAELMHLEKRFKKGRSFATHRYRWIDDVPLRDGADALHVNWFALDIINTAGKVTYRSSFVTDLPVNKDTIAELADCARARWKIENENFNTLKTKGYNLEHNFGHGQKHLAAVLVTLNLLAFAFHTVCDLVDAAWARARDTIGSRRSFFEELRTITRYLVFPTWRSLITTLTTGQPPPQR